MAREGGLRHFGRLASRSRFTGSPGVEEARRYCASALRDIGFAVVERNFSYSAWPATVGAPAAGFLSALAITAAARSAAAGSPGLAALTLAASLAAIAHGARWLARRGVLDLRAMRRRGVNLEATRAGGAPRVWLMAHVDSKWQPVPTVVRAMATVAIVGAMLAALLLALAQRAGVSGAGGWWSTIVPAGWIAALPLIGSLVGGGAPGAVDNASGVAAVLAAAGLVARDAPVGVLITDAEELGLAGARAWSAGRGGGTALNCDSIDDRGVFTLMYSGDRPRRVTTAMEETSARMRQPLRTIRVLPGILTDSVALADAGFEAVTLSRGSMRTLARIHTMSDSLTRMRGTEIDRAAELLAGAAMALLETEAS
jgi:Peptidase family M28